MPTPLTNNHLATRLAEKRIDNVVACQTPEGVELMLMPAGVLPRLGAWLVDLLVRLAILFVIGIALGMFGLAGQGILLIVYFLLDWFYAVLFEVFYHGQTIGKKQFGIQVCQDDGTPIRWQASMIRNLLRLADFLPFAFLSGIISMLFHPASKRLGDMVAGTMVIYLAEHQDSYNIPHGEAIALPLPLQFDEQQAILAFAERCQSLPDDRRQELAQILNPLASLSTSSLSVSNNSQTLAQTPALIIGYANTIMGR